MPGFPPKHFTDRFLSHQVTQILTGHSRLNTYLTHIGITDDPVCSCNNSIETIDHYLFECEKEHMKREKTIKQKCLEQSLRVTPEIKELVSNRH